MAGASGAYAEYKVKFHEMTEPCWETCWIHLAQPAACRPSSLANSSMTHPDAARLLGGSASLAFGTTGLCQLWHGAGCGRVVERSWQGPGCIWCPG